MDKTEFVSIINAQKKLIYKIVNSYCSNIEDRKDLEQEILIQLWKSLKKFDGRVKVTTWMYRVALNTAITFYRRDRKRKTNYKTVTPEIISLQPAENDSEADENIRFLYAAINSLSNVDKALILLHLENHKHQEIAEILGLSTTNVATKISRIKKKIKRKNDTLWKLKN